MRFKMFQQLTSAGIFCSVAFLTRTVHLTNTRERKSAITWGGSAGSFAVQLCCTPSTETNQENNRRTSWGCLIHVPTFSLLRLPSEWWLKVFNEIIEYVHLGSENCHLKRTCNAFLEMLLKEMWEGTSGTLSKLSKCLALCNEAKHVLNSLELFIHLVNSPAGGNAFLHCNNEDLGVQMRFQLLASLSLDHAQMTLGWCFERTSEHRRRWIDEENWSCLKPHVVTSEPVSQHDEQQGGIKCCSALSMILV